MFRRFHAALFLSVALFSFARFASADTPALTGISGGVPIQDDSFVVGWIFDVNAPISVTALGVYDPSGVLDDSSEIGIFNVVDQSLVVSATIESTGTMLDDFLYQSIVPVSLEEGGTYVIAMTDFGIGGVGMAASLTTADEINYVNSAFDFGDALVFPDPGNDGAQAIGIFGPNFTFVDDPYVGDGPGVDSTTVDPAPEPAYGIPVGVTALIGFSVARRFRRA